MFVIDQTDSASGDRILWPASVYCPKKRTVAMASKEVGIHIPFSLSKLQSDMNTLEPNGWAFGGYPSIRQIR
jgi:hypothetical protein